MPLRGVEVAIGFCVSIRAVRKWMSRYLQGGVETLADRSLRRGAAATLSRGRMPVACYSVAEDAHDR